MPKHRRAEVAKARKKTTLGITSRVKALLIARAAKSKKAEDLVVLDMRKVSNFTDYFVIASGSSDRQVKAIADGIEEALNKKGLSVWHKDGYKEATWIVIDCGNVIAHIFYTQTREFYLLERLWNDAPRVALK